MSYLIYTVFSEVNKTKVFDQETIWAILSSVRSTRGEIHESSCSNIRKAPESKKKTLIKSKRRSYLITQQQRKIKKGR